MAFLTDNLSVFLNFYQVQISLGDIGQLLDSLVVWVLETADTDLQRNSALHMIASILNKHIDGTRFNYDPETSPDHLLLSRIGFVFKEQA